MQAADNTPNRLIEDLRALLRRVDPVPAPVAAAARDLYGRRGSLPPAAPPAGPQAP